MSGYPGCTRILRHRGLIMGDILGESDSVWVSPMYTDKANAWIAHHSGLHGIVHVSIYTLA